MIEIKRVVWMIFPASLMIFLTGCITTNGYQMHRAACKQLRSDIVFSGSTSDTRRAEIEYAQEPLQQHTYDVNNCDSVP